MVPQCPEEMVRVGWLHRKNRPKTRIDTEHQNGRCGQFLGPPTEEDGDQYEELSEKANNGAEAESKEHQMGNAATG